MLDILDTTLNKLPNLMTQKSTWESLNINYEAPNVERIWKQYGDIRINLHRIFPSTKNFFHPHPWPCAVVILKGKYEMGLGYGSKRPPVMSRSILNEGSKYEMVHKHAWHYIKPLDEPVYSVMVSGLPWVDVVSQNSNNISLAPLSNDVFKELFDIFTQLVNEYTSQRLKI